MLINNAEWTRFPTPPSWHRPPIQYNFTWAIWWNVSIFWVRERKLLFGDDVVDYILAETKLYVQQKRSESDIVCNARRTKKWLLVVERKRHVWLHSLWVLHCANILAFFSIIANFNNTGTFLLNYFVYTCSKDSVKWYYVFLMYSHLSNQYSYCHGGKFEKLITEPNF